MVRLVKLRLEVVHLVNDRSSFAARVDLNDREGLVPTGANQAHR